MKLQDWNIIVVEDTYDDIQLTSALLTFHGANVIIAKDGDECLRLLNEVEPRVIITDLSMPTMDGWEMLSRIRARHETAHIPVVAVTAYHSIYVAKDAVHAGFDAYFEKPLSARTFVQNLVSLIEEKS